MARAGDDGGADDPDRGSAKRFVCEMLVKTARPMIGIADYDTYVPHRQTTQPDLPNMTYKEVFREGREARYAVAKDRLRGGC